jgi:hypothetical protein
MVLGGSPDIEPFRRLAGVDRERHVAGPVDVGHEARPRSDQKSGLPSKPLPW